MSFCAIRCDGFYVLEVDGDETVAIPEVAPSVRAFVETKWQNSAGWERRRSD